MDLLGFSIEVMAAAMMHNCCTAVRGGWISFEEWSGHSEPGATTVQNPKPIWCPSQN
jgi:hypothetical protein